jgi:pimeloyl-ACP methyl ester carboxylesterase
MHNLTKHSLRSTINNQFIFNLENFKTISSHHEFNSSKPTIMFIHGYLETRNSYSSTHIVAALRKHRGYNILVCDWGRFSTNLYFTIILPRLYEIGVQIAKCLKELFVESKNLAENFHLVGHSLGAQVSGLIGRIIANETSFKLSRITALDPASPGFYPEVLDKFKHISSTDALVELFFFSF